MLRTERAHWGFIGKLRKTNDGNRSGGSRPIVRRQDLAQPAHRFARVAGLKGGHTYVARGPLIEPSVMLRADRKIEPGEELELELTFDLKSVAGLKELKLLSGEGTMDSRAFDGANEARTTFTVSPGQDAGYVVSVEDVDGSFAYSNPLWVDVVAFQDVLAAH